MSAGPPGGPVALDPSVVAGWAAWTARFEGRVSWMYLDVRGLVTTGLGCLIDRVEHAVGLRWLHGDGSPAGFADVADDWHAVKGMEKGLAAYRYRLPDGLHLPDDEIDALALTRLAANARAVAEQLPELAGWPPEVQRLCMSHAWACGASWPAHWPRLVAALRAGDWQGAADECRISEAGNPGVRARNDAVEQLLRGLS